MLKEQVHLTRAVVTNFFILQIFAVVHFDVEKERLLKRLDCRLTCSGCGGVYSSSFLNNLSSCPKCGQPIQKRKDDTVDVLERRLSVYEKETLPLVQKLKERESFISLKCEDDPELVTKQLLTALASMEERYLETTLDSCTWLESQLKRPHDDAERASLLTRFRDKALKENFHNRTGIMRRFVFLKTSNMKKFAEHTNIFTGLYGIEVLRVPPDLDDVFVKGLLQIKTQNLVPLAVIREESNLYRPNSEEFCSLSHGVRAVNRARMWCYTLQDGKLKEKLYEYNTSGRIDLHRRSSYFNTGEVFGWDDIFVLSSSNLSYHQLQQWGIKRSSRDMVISDYLRDNVYYKNLLDVEFNKQSPQRVIDFSNSVSTFVEKNVYYNNPLAVQYGYRNLQNHVLNFGVFFRAAKNRRQVRQFIYQIVS